MNAEKLIIKGAREHNLKNIHLELPRNKLIVFTGLSGSGKSSLAFDTIYAEGQRRYVESLSAYARQFLEQMQKPDVDSIEGLSPAISIDQKAPPRNPRSTVGTVTEIYDYFRLLFANIGIPHCPKCGKKIEKQTSQQIVDQILELPAGQRIMILAPVIRGRKGEYKNLFADIQKDGFVRVRVDKKIYDIADAPALNKKVKHDIEIVVDRLAAKASNQKRLNESVEVALKFGNGIVMVLADKAKAKPIIYSEKFSCPECGISLDEITPRIFSFNGPYGACPTCSGLGDKLEFDPDLVIPDKKLTLADGAIVPWGDVTSYYLQKLAAVGEEYGFDLQTPIKRLNKTQLNVILYGSKKPIMFKYQMDRGYWEHEGEFKGVMNWLKRRYLETKSENVRFHLYRYMSKVPCPDCGGQRLRPESLAVTIANKSIAELAALSVKAIAKFIDELKLNEREQIIARQIIKEIKERLQFLENVGLDYITLNRQSSTLSGGEAQRTRLATQVGSGLVGVLYILDEPSIGLHQRDNKRLIKTLERLRELGNTIIVVEHDEETMRSADFLVDIGPGAGRKGGKIVATGSAASIEKNKNSITGQYLSGKLKIPLPAERKSGNGKQLVIKKAKHNNL